MADSYGFILGLLIVGFLMGLVLVFCALVFYLQHKVRKSAYKKVVMTTWRASGDSDDELQTTDGNNIVVPGEGKLKGFDKKPMIRPDKASQIWWPPGRPRLLQVHLNRYLYSEGNPEPWDPFDRPVVINDEVLGNLQNVNFSRAMVGRSEEIVSSQQQFRPKPKPSMWLWIILGGCGLGIIFMLYFVFGVGV